MPSKRRVRCFICKKLVAPNQPDIESFTFDTPYSVIPLHISNKSGCVCSSCITYYAEKIETDIEIKAGKYDDLSNKPSTIEVEPTVTKPKLSPEEEEEKNFRSLMKRYECLDYSLDSLAKQVGRFVYGQNQAIQDVLYSMYFNQMSNMLEDIGQPPLKHKHILLIGGTGVGKTLLATTSARVFGVTHSVSNATPITSAGYVGDKIENVIERLLAAAKGDLIKAQNGIIILDEFDKKCSSPDNSGKDVTGKAVQQELLKLLEPSTIWIKQNTIPFYTGNLTVILMGAFVGLDEIIEARTKTSRIGFGICDDTPKNIDKTVTPDDLIKYGFIPEIVGRIPIICQLNKLTHSVVVDIIYAQLSRYSILFELKDFEFYFDPILIDKLATEILKSQTGARDVETKIDEILRPALYRVFQSPSEGICEIDSNGAIKLLVHNIYRSDCLETIEMPPIKKYLDLATEYN